MVEHTEQFTCERAKRRTSSPAAAEVFAHMPVTDTVEILPEVVKQGRGLYERIGEERIHGFRPFSWESV